MSLGRLQLFGINLFKLSVSQQPPDFLLFLKGLSPYVEYSSHVSANIWHIGIGTQWRSSERTPRRVGWGETALALWWTAFVGSEEGECSE